MSEIETVIDDIITILRKNAHSEGEIIIILCDDYGTETKKYTFTNPTQDILALEAIRKALGEK